MKKNCLVVWKMIWEIWQIFIRAFENLKNLHFNELLLTKVYNVWAEKVQMSYVLMALIINAKFEGKLTCASKNDMRYLVNLDFYWVLLSKVENAWYMSLKFAEELCVMTMRNDAKFEEDLTCQFKTDMMNLTNFDLSTWKSQIFALYWAVFDQSI